MNSLTRRESLRIGGLSALGLSMPALLRSRAGTTEPRRRDRACIVLFLMGGPTQHSTWDPKPDAPTEVRGAFGAIDTNVPGIRIGELFPKLSRHADKLCLLRAMSTSDNAHSSSGYAMLTGVPHNPLNAEGVNPGPPNDYPSLAAIVRRLRGDRGGLPGSVRLPMHIFNTDNSVWPGQEAGFLGRSGDPWLFRCDPGAERIAIPELTLAADVTADRLTDRRGLLQTLDRHIAAGPSGVRSPSKFNDQAFDLLASPRARAAFDLTKERPSLRDGYGRTGFGQSCLLARRLIEAGVGLVQVNWPRASDESAIAPVWDTHADEAGRLKKTLAPTADAAIAALLEDLDRSGLLEDTLVMCISEFGRSPKFNPAGGRDHWGQVFSVALAGGGIRGGQVYGSSDRQAAQPKSGRVTPQDLTATALHCLGYEPDAEIRDTLGRPYGASRGDIIRSIV